MRRPPRSLGIGTLGRRSPLPNLSPGGGFSPFLESFVHEPVSAEDDLRPRLS